MSRYIAFDPLPTKVRTRLRYHLIKFLGTRQSFCPTIYFDERPVQLTGEVVTPLPMQAGQHTRFDYEYERHGTCSLLVAFEPLTGRR